VFLAGLIPSEREVFHRMQVIQVTRQQALLLRPALGLLLLLLCEKAYQPKRSPKLFEDNIRMGFTVIPLSCEELVIMRLEIDPSFVMTFLKRKDPLPVTRP